MALGLSSTERSRLCRARQKKRRNGKDRVAKHRLDKKKKEMAKKANTVNGGKKVNVEEIDTETHSMLKALVERILAKEGDFDADEKAILREAFVDIKDISIRARIAEAIETAKETIDKAIDVYGSAIDVYGSQSRSAEFHASKKPAKKGTTTYSSDDENSSDVEKEKENSTG